MPNNYAIDPTWLTQQAQGLSALNELRSIPQSAQYAMALRGANQPILTPGNPAEWGYAGPTALDVFANLATRKEGRDQLGQMDQRVAALRGTTTEGQKAELEQAEAIRQQEMDFQRELAQMKADQVAAVAQRKADEPPKLKPPAKAQTDYMESERLLGVMKDLNGMYAGMNEGAKKEVNRPLMTAALSYLPNAGQRIAEDMVYKEPSSREYLTRGARFESKLSQLMSGLAVTIYEMNDRRNWSPFAPGIPQQERQIRLKNIAKDLVGAMQNYERMYPEYTFSKLQGNAETQMPELDVPSEIKSPLQELNNINIENIGNIIDETTRDLEYSKLSQDDLKMTDEQLDAEIERLQRELLGK